MTSTPHNLAWLRLQRDSSTALNRQIEDALRAAILNGRLAAGARLPASRALARDLGVARSTVTQAFEQLAAEGYLHGVSGRGTCVADDLPDRSTPAPPPSRLKSEASSPSRGRWLSPSLPATDGFPLGEWQRIGNRLMRENPAEWMDYSDPAGLPVLREAISAYLNEQRGLICEPHRVLVVSGSQQALDLISRATDGPVWLEEPGYVGIRQVFRARELVPLPVDSEGCVVDALPDSMPAGLIVVTPTHQYPLGATLSLPRRLALLEKAARSRSWIVEDEYGADYCYRGRPPQPLQALDEAQRVIYVGSFSKTLFPGLRLGFMVAPEELVERLTALRRSTDGFSPPLTQAQLAAFISSGRFHAHVRRSRTLYAKRREALLEALKELSGVLHVLPGDAGMHFTCLFVDDTLDERAFCARARQHDIQLSPLSDLYFERKPQPGVLIGFANTPEAGMPDLVGKLKAIALELKPASR